VYARQAAGRDHVLQYLDGVVLHDADIGLALLGDAFEQRADPGFVHLAAQEVVLRTHGGDVRCGFPHAETDFQHQRCAPPEGRGRIQRRLAEREDQLGAQFLEGARLRGRGAPSTADIAFDGLGMRHIQRRAGRGSEGQGFGHRGKL